MFLDMVTGIAKQFVINPQGITSHNFWVGMVKKLITFLLIIALGVTFLGTGIDGKSFITWVI